MNEYRLTRSRGYDNLTCLGHNNLSAREGYYITAKSELEAFKKMCQLYPLDCGNFTCDLWKENIYDITMYVAEDAQ